MCKYIRNELFKHIKQICNSSGNDDVKVNEKQLKRIIELFVQHHNFEVKVKQYNATPANITREEVERTNLERESHNAKIESKHNF
jgi:deoxyhypusine synthase